MSGYLEVKYPFKSNLGLNPFKSWKRQWCILRPSPTFSGGILAVYCSEAGASAGTVELPCGFVVRWAKSRSRPHAFAVYPAEEPRKPRVLMAASTRQDADTWMSKIRCLINGNKLQASDTSLRDTYSVTVNTSKFSRKCGLSGADSTVTVSPSGVLVSRSQKPGIFAEWKHVAGVALTTDSEVNGTCILTLKSECEVGGGSLHLVSPLAGALAAALRRGLSAHGAAFSTKLSKSEGDLRASKCSDIHLGDVRRSSWYSGPSEVSLDDLDLITSKEYKRIPLGQLARCSAAGDLAPPADDSMCDRRSMASVASGIYEEIPDPAPASESVYCKMSRDSRPLLKYKLETSMSLVVPELEPQYECVAECVYGTMRRRRPPSAAPPLPPRTKDSSTKPGSTWPSGVTRHSSLGSLPHDAPLATRTLPRWDRSRQAFSAFRKRLKSDSRTAISPKSETKEKDVETKKKKFEFTPSRDIFKSFKVSRKRKNTKSNNLSKGETKSCEFLDDTEHVTTNRCSKSVECLEGSDEYLAGFDADLSIEFDDTVAALSLPQEIVQLILNSQDRMGLHLKSEVEGDYMPMSPIVPAPAGEHHYIVMSPKANKA